MKYFKPSEFVVAEEDWWPYMHVGVLSGLDRFRGEWGAPVLISPAPGSLGRRLGADRKSRHNIDLWGLVMAADVMLPDMKTADDRKRARDCAEKAGFDGIGVYPEWQPHQGLHVDMRDAPARWAHMDGAYVDINQAFV